MPEKAATTHVMMDNQLVLYRRENSTIWQCRFKVDGAWQRATTKQHKLKDAKVAARDLMVEAKIRKRSKLPVITRKFRHVAKLAIDRMDSETAAGRGKASFVDYKRIIDDYLIPHLGNHSITNITYAVLETFDAWRIEQMGKAPTHSTLLSHNAALNRVFDEAVARSFLTDANRPKLEAKGKQSDRRPDFDLNEARALLANFDAWIERGRNDQSKELRHLLRDYVEVLLDTGARPGGELMDLKWKQVQFAMKPVVTPTNEVEEVDDPGRDEHGRPIELPNLNRSCLMTVSGKTGQREIAGMKPTVKAFERIIKRNYGIANPITDPFKGIKPVAGARSRRGRGHQRNRLPWDIPSQGRGCPRRCVIACLPHVSAKVGLVPIGRTPRWGCSQSSGHATPTLTERLAATTPWIKQADSASAVCQSQLRPRDWY